MNRRSIAVLLTATGLWLAADRASAAPLTDGSVALSSEFSVGRLDSLLRVDPDRFGARGTLSPSWVPQAGDHPVQTLVINSATAGLSVLWRSGASEIRAGTSVVARHSPDGFGGTEVDVVPESLGIGLGYQSSSPLMPVIDTWFGRFRLTDPSRLVLSELVDGASVVLRWTSVSAELGGGLTSFVSKYSYGVRIDGADAVYATARYLAPPRRLLVARLDALVPPAASGLAGHAAGVFGVYVDDLSATGGDRAYAGVVVRGIVFAFAYDASTVVSIDDGGVLVGAGLRYPGDPAARSAVTVAAHYASGGRTVGRFVPVTAAPQGAVLALPLENLLVVSVDAESGLPRRRSAAADRVRFGLSLSGFALPAADAPAGLSAGWIGGEATGSIVVDLLSDLSIDSAAGVAVTAGGVVPHARIRGRLDL